MSTLTQLYTGEIKEPCTWTALSDGQSVVDTTRLSDPNPSVILTCYDADFINKFLKLASYTDKLTGDLRSDMFATTSNGFELNVANKRAEPGILMTEEGRRDLRRVSLYDLVIKDKLKSSTSTIGDYSMEAIITTAESPQQTFYPSPLSEVTWWLENYQQINIKGMTETIDKGQLDKDVKIVQEKARRQTPWVVSDPTTQALGMEYAILRQIGKFINYEENEINPLDTLSKEEERRIVEAIPLSNWYAKTVATHLFPYNAKFAGKTVTVLPLPACLIHKIDKDQIDHDGPNGSEFLSLQREKARFSFFSLLRKPYDEWVKDFWERVSQSIDSSLWNVWAAFFPAGVTPLNVKAESLRARENLLTARDVFCSDGVYSDQSLSPADEAYATLSNGYLRKKMLLSRSKSAASVKALLNAPPLWVVPESTSLTDLPIRSTIMPSVMSSQKPPNVFTPYTRNLYTDEWFLNLSSGVGPSIYTDLTIQTLAGGRDPQDDDILYSSGFYLAQKTGFKYTKPNFDIGSFYVLNTAGYAVTAARTYMQIAYLAGVYKKQQSDYVLDDIEKQADLAERWHELEKSNPRMIFALSVKWHTVRWVQSAGALQLSAFSTVRDSI